MMVARRYSARSAPDATPIIARTSDSGDYLIGVISDVLDHWRLDAGPGQPRRISTAKASPRRSPHRHPARPENPSSSKRPMTLHIFDRAQSKNLSIIRHQSSNGASVRMRRLTTALRSIQSIAAGREYRPTDTTWQVDNGNASAWPPSPIPPIVDNGMKGVCASASRRSDAARASDRAAPPADSSAPPPDQGGAEAADRRHRRRCIDDIQIELFVVGEAGAGQKMRRRTEGAAASTGLTPAGSRTTLHLDDVRIEPVSGVCIALLRRNNFKFGGALHRIRCAEDRAVPGSGDACASCGNCGENSISMRPPRNSFEVGRIGVSLSPWR